MARSCASSDWMSNLPLVLLGIRSSVREDSNTSPGELLYGAVLRLPGQMLPGFPQDEVSPSSLFVRDLRDKIKNTLPLPVLYHGDRPTHLPSDLRSASHVFVRIDAARPPLSRPYEGPFLVLNRSQDLKTFTLDRACRAWTVSVDRLKPAFFHKDWSSRPLGHCNQSPVVDYDDPAGALPWIGPVPAQVPAPAPLPFQLQLLLQHQSRLQFCLHRLIDARLLPQRILLLPAWSLLPRQRLLHVRAVSRGLPITTKLDPDCFVTDFLFFHGATTEKSENILVAFLVLFAFFF